MRDGITKNKSELSVIHREAAELYTKVEQVTIHWLYRSIKSMKNKQRLKLANCKVLLTLSMSNYNLPLEKGNKDKRDLFVHLKKRLSS